MSIVKYFGSGFFSAGCPLVFPLSPSADFLAFPEKKKRLFFYLWLHGLQLSVIELFYFLFFFFFCFLFFVLFCNGELIPSTPENYGKIKPSPTTTPFKQQTLINILGSTLNLNWRDIKVKTKN